MNKKPSEWLPEWRLDMAGSNATKPISKTKAANILGIERRTYQRWETDASVPPNYLAYACSALVDGLQRFDER